MRKIYVIMAISYLVIMTFFNFVIDNDIKRGLAFLIWTVMYYLYFIGVIEEIYEDKHNENKNNP